MTLNRRKMLARLQQQDSTVQELADAAGVAFQTAWRWLQDQRDMCNVSVAIKGVSGKQATRWAWIGGRDDQAEDLLYRAADYLRMRSPCPLGARLSQEITHFLER